MIYCVLTALGAFLLSGKLWLAVPGFVVGVVLTRYFRGRVGEIIEKRGGVETAKVLRRVCYSDDGTPARAGDNEYTVLVKFRNGERYKYVLRGDTALFCKLRPYISN